MDFGDELSSGDQNPPHVYTSPGLYDVELIAQNAEGCIDTLLVSELIQIGGPTGSFDYQPLEGCIPHEVDFNAVSTDAATFIFDFRDGNLETLPSLNDGVMTAHIYDSAGTFVPIMILEDSLGCQTVIPGLDTIRTELLTFDFSSTDPVLCGGSEITFQTYVVSSEAATI